VGVMIHIGVAKNTFRKSVAKKRGAILIIKITNLGLFLLGLFFTIICYTFKKCFNGLNGYNRETLFF
jgi:hypothetical protein